MPRFRKAALTPALTPGLGDTMPQLSSYLPSAIALLPLMFVAVVLAATRPNLRSEVRTSTRFFAVVGLTILMQSLHFLEELRSDFFIRLPETFGLQPFTETVFVTFNATWLAIWVISLFAVRAGLRFSCFPLWFLGLAMVLNLLAHPLLALRAGGYFPGLLTAPLVGVLGVLTIRELVRVTASESVT